MAMRCTLDMSLSCGTLSKNLARSMSTIHPYPSLKSSRHLVIACWALRLGLNPYDDSEKNRSALGVRACEIACCTTLSLAVGIPSFLTPPLGLGISFRLTGVGS